MRPNILETSLLVVALLAPCNLWGHDARTRLVTIKVSEPLGVGIAHAQIRLVPKPDPVPAKLETEEKGQLPLNLKAGGYALFVSGQGFKTARPHLEIAPPEDEGSASQIVAVALQIADVGSSVAVHPKDSLVITAEPYDAPVVLSPAVVRAVPHVEVKVHNGHNDANEIYSGVPLVTLLAKVNAPTGKELRKEAYVSYVIASGTDGYSVLLSIAEIDPAFHAGQVLVADIRNGQLHGSSGPFQLIVTDDKRPARWVRNLNSITLQNAH